MCVMDTTHPLRTYRKQAGITAAALAARIGVTRTTLNRWETGQRRIDRNIRATVSEVTGISEAVLEGIAPAETAKPEASVNG